MHAIHLYSMVVSWIFQGDDCATSASHKIFDYIHVRKTSEEFARVFNFYKIKIGMCLNSDLVTDLMPRVFAIKLSSI